MLKTVCDQSEEARLQYGRSDQADDHKESSNSMSRLDTDKWQDAAGPAMWFYAWEHSVLLKKMPPDIQ